MSNRQSHTVKTEWDCLLFYLTSIGILTSIFFRTIPYPVVGSLISTCVTILRFASWQACYATVALPRTCRFGWSGCPTGVWSIRDNKCYKFMISSAIKALTMPITALKVSFSLKKMLAIEVEIIRDAPWLNGYKRTLSKYEAAIVEKYECKLSATAMMQI